jgi:hypothetical protein
LGEAESQFVAAEEAAATDKGEQPPSDDPKVTISVENYLPENIPTFYSDGMVVLHTANEFILSFLLTDFPLAVGKEELEQVGLIRRKCVARIIMSPAQFEATSTALRENLKKYYDSNRPKESE